MKELKILMLTSGGTKHELKAEKFVKMRYIINSKDCILFSSPYLGWIAIRVKTVLNLSNKWLLAGYERTTTSYMVEPFLQACFKITTSQEEFNNTMTRILYKQALGVKQ